MNMEMFIFYARREMREREHESRKRTIREEEGITGSVEGSMREGMDV